MLPWLAKTDAGGNLTWQYLYGPGSQYFASSTVMSDGGYLALGYAVAPVRQGRGIATAVVEELVSRARTAGVRVVSAHTLAEENASTAVLRKSGFTRTAELREPDGDVWRWERALTESAEHREPR